MSRPYIFDEWMPNLYFGLLGMGLWVYLIYAIEDVFIVILMLVMVLSFGWSMSFARQKRYDYEN